MSHHVYANEWEIAAKSGNNKSIARFPDVCLSPPSPPAGPVPVPYPDTSFSTDLKNGSKTVKIAGKPAALAQQSYYKPSALGNEAATRSFGGNVITHQVSGKTYFQAWSMDVKLDGKNVCRHIDLTTSNHGSAPPATPPAPSAEAQTLADAKQAVEAGKCPCCGENLHPWQKDADGTPFTPMKENEFWQKKIGQVSDPKKQANFQKTFGFMKAAKASVRKGEVECPNVHTNDESGCALYFDVPKGARSVYVSPRTGARLETPAATAKLHFTARDKSIALQVWSAARPDLSLKSVKLNHKTPTMAAGCNHPHNVTPASVMPGRTCRDIEAWQSDLEQINNFL